MSLAGKAGLALVAVLTLPVPAAAQCTPTAATACVPSLVGRELREAVAAIEAAGLEHAIILSDEAPTSAQENTVQDQRPKAGFEVRRGSPVRIWLFTLRMGTGTGAPPSLVPPGGSTGVFGAGGGALPAAGGAPGAATARSIQLVPTGASYATGTRSTSPPPAPPAEPRPTNDTGPPAGFERLRLRLGAIDVPAGATRLVDDEFKAVGEWPSAAGLVNWDLTHEPSRTVSSDSAVQDLSARLAAATELTLNNVFIQYLHGKPQVIGSPRVLQGRTTCVATAIQYGESRLIQAMCRGARAEAVRVEVRMDGRDVAVEQANALAVIRSLLPASGR